MTLSLVAPPSGALTFFDVASGDVDGGYFAATGAICDIVNAKNTDVLRCSPESTPGSLYNIKALRNGDVDFALAQSDWQRRAYEGTDVFAADGPLESLRGVMGLYPEAITILASRDSGIRSLRDLRGKTIDIGVPSSGRRGTARYLLLALGLEEQFFADVLGLPSGTAIQEICSGQIDATILVTGHPNASVNLALSECGARLVPAQGPAIDSLLADGRDYEAMPIRASDYPTLDADVPTFGVYATLLTLANSDDLLVETLVRQTLASQPLLAVRAPVLSGLNPDGMRTLGMTVPLHPGAAAAYDADPEAR
jgi:TRAP transporter TAXI family solute receptor